MDLRCKYAPTIGIAVTGATGYIGQKLLHAFGSNLFMACSIEDIEKGTRIIHLAANVEATRTAYVENISIDSLILQVANDRQSPLVYASTNNVYPRRLHCDVNSGLQADDFYSASKIIGEKILSDMAIQPVTILRLADVFGPRQRHGNLFHAIEKCLIDRLPLKLYGSGMRRRSFIHVDDVVGVIRYITSSDSMQSKIYNVAYPDSASVSEIISEVAKQAQLEVDLVDYSNESTDERTLLPTAMRGYQKNWETFRGSLSDYVIAIMKRNER